MEFVAVFATCVIALFTIALFVLQFLQHRHEKRVSRANYALALHEKRLEVYFEFEKLQDLFIQEQRVPLREAVRFLHNCRNAGFLFPKQTEKFLDELFRNSMALERTHYEASSSADDKMEAMARKEMKDIQDWFRNQIRERRLAKEFDPYLKLPESL